jgi:glycosyltransferase involved in cell wall biosynthesis
MHKIPLSVQILTRNSSKGLKKLLPALSPFAEILLIDGNSTDETLSLAKKYNCRVIRQEDTDEVNINIKDFSKVRNKGIKEAFYDWQLVVDSDEYIDDLLIDEILGIIQNNDINNVYYIPRKFVDNGKIIDVCMGYPNKQIRLFNRISSVSYSKPVHEKLIFDKDKIVVKDMKNCMYIPLDDYQTMKKKGEKYLLMSVDALGYISFHRWLRWCFYFHFRASISYALRLILSSLKKGHHMPLKYELYIFYYNHKMIILTFKKMIRHLFYTS